MNIIEKLKSLGVEVTPEIEKAFDGDFISLLELDKKIGKIEKERDAYKLRAEQAEETLKGFEGKDFEAITKDRDEWKVKYETFVREQEEARDNAEFEECISAGIKNAKGRNEKAIRAQLDLDLLRKSKNRDKDIADAIKAISDNEATAFLFETDPENNRARFTGSMGNSGNGGNGGSKMSMSELMRYKNEHPEADIKSLM